MVNVVITGIGLVSALGTNLESSWQNLLAGESGIKLHQPFPELNQLPLGLIYPQPTSLNILSEMVVNSALQDAELISPLPDCAVVIGSSRGYQADWERFAQQMYGQHPSQVLNLSTWLDTLPHLNAIASARQIGATGIVLAPMAACATGISAIAQATVLIQTGQCEQAIAGAVEAAITPLTLTGFQQMGALAKTGSYPFDIHREGLVLGEGAAVFILESAELAKKRHARIYGEILGFSGTNDAYHPNKPEPSGRSAIMAIQQCLQRSRLKPEDIDYIHAHGTGTRLNDQIESMIIQQIFPPHIPVSSTKGSTGHTLGASSALGVAFSLMALKDYHLPPCVGLREPEFNLNFVMSANVERNKHPIHRVLCLSFGFGGQNGAMVLSRYR